MLNVTENGGALLNSLGDSIPEPPMGTALMRWFAVQTRPRHEKKVARELLGKSVCNFLPLLSEKHSWSDRQREVQMPLFPGYVFVRLQDDLDGRIPVLRTMGVVGFVGGRGLGSAIPDDQIQAIQSVLDAKVPVGPYPFLKIGQMVRIIGGSLDGVKGIIAGKNGDASLVISIEMIQRSIAIRVAGYRVEPV